MLDIEREGFERILDLGCGDGEHSGRLALRVPKGFVLGIDSSLSMISAALTCARTNLAFRLQDINQLDYEQEFDVIFSNSALHWVKEGLRTTAASTLAFSMH